MEVEMSPERLRELIAGGETLEVEFRGEERRDKAAKAATARNLWIPAVNNDGRFGRWAFVEVTDPWDAKNTIRAALRAQMPSVLKEG
jgi:hypothetical protein